MEVAAIRSDMLDPTPEDTPDVECLPVPAEAWRRREGVFCGIHIKLTCVENIALVDYFFL